MDELTNLYNIYQSNIKKEDLREPKNEILIKAGDIVIASHNNKEIRSEVFSVFENKFQLKSKNGTKIYITMDDIIEHYPKNVKFQNFKKESKEDIFIDKPVEETPKKTDIPNKPIDKKRKFVKSFNDNKDKNSPENQIDLTINENVKIFGKVVKYKNIKFSEIENMFEKRILSVDNVWYCLTEKNNEIHIVRHNNNGFKIQPFTVALVDHFLKSNKPINESMFNQIKIKGNDNFAIISNIPQKVYGQILGSLISLLSK